MSFGVIHVASAFFICLIGMNALPHSEKVFLERLFDMELHEKPFHEGFDYVNEDQQEHPMFPDNVLPHFSEYDVIGERPEDIFPGRNLQFHHDSAQYGSMAQEIRSNDLKDPETGQQSSLWGTHYVSGGAGEGNQVLKPNGQERNRQEVKTDNVLPAYCEPPNPCPKGYSETNNCMDDVNDTPPYNRIYIEEQQQSGYCACDTEHMKHCPNDKPRIDANMYDTPDKTDLELAHPLNENNMDGGVAKKAPRILIQSLLTKMKAPYGINPYFNGFKLRTVAKKSPQAIDSDRLDY